MSLSARPSLVRRLPWLALALLVLPGRALAAPFDDSQPRTELDPWTDDDEPPRRSRGTSPLGAPMTISIGGSFNQIPTGEPAYGAMLRLELPLDRVAAHAVRAAIAEDPRMPPRPPLRQKVDLSPPPPPPPKLPVQPTPEPPLRLPVVVTPGAARAAVEAALRRAHLTDPDARLDELAARARRAAGLPSLRLRVMRTVDDGDTLSPTSYDPYRIVAVDDIRFSVEAAATWRLDRLLFAREEIMLERMRHERADAQHRLSAHVLRLLFEWQRARAMAENPGLTPEDNLAARLRAIEAEAEVDLLTDGWFTRWRAANEVAPPPS